MYCEEFSVTRVSLWMVSAETETRRSSKMYASIQHNFRFINGDRVTPVSQLFFKYPAIYRTGRFITMHTRCSVAATVSHVVAHKVQKQRQMRCIHHVQTVDPTSLPPKLRSAEFAVVNNSEYDAAYRWNQGPRDLPRP